MFVNEAGKIIDTRRASIVSMVKLLDPKGLLTKVFSSSAIKMVNDKVSKVYQKRLLPQVLHPLNRSLTNI